MANNKFGWRSGIVKAKEVIVSGDMTIGGDLAFGDATTDTLTVTGKLDANGNVDLGSGDDTINVGSGSGDTLNIKETATVAGAKKVQFRDTGLYVYSSADGQLDIIADTTAKVTSPAIELEGTLTLDGDISIDGAHTFGTGTGNVSINGDALLATNKKVQFRDTGLYINSGADGKLTISADGSGADDITLSGTVTLDANLTTPGRIICTASSASYDAPVIGVGIWGTGLADTALVDNILVTIVNRSGVNKTSADSSSMALGISNATTAAVTNNKIQGILVSTNIGHNVYDAYGVQSNFLVSETMATQAGNANLVAGAFKAAITDTKTATGNVSSLYVVTGDTGATSGSVATGKFDAIRFENNATNLNSYMNFGGCTGVTYAMSFDAIAGCVTASQLTGGTSAYLTVSIGGVAHTIQATRAA